MGMYMMVQEVTISISHAKKLLKKYCKRSDRSMTVQEVKVYIIQRQSTVRERTTRACKGCICGYKVLGSLMDGNLKFFMLMFNRECAAGSTDAGACFEAGYIDVEKNIAMAAEMYERSFEMGYKQAATNLGLLYEDGCNERDFANRLDPVQGVKWFEEGHIVRCPRATTIGARCKR